MGNCWSFFNLLFENKSFYFFKANLKMSKSHQTTNSKIRMQEKVPLCPLQTRALAFGPCCDLSSNWFISTFGLNKGVSAKL
ncbi:hypothetical protein ACRRTK_005569 [Alexandromys fortis]